MLDVVTDFYEKLGYSIELVGCGLDNFNRAKARNKIFQDYDVDFAVILNADTVVSENAIVRGIEFVKEKNLVVKPFTKIITITGMDETFTNKLVNNDIMDSYMSSGSSRMLPQGGGWIMSRRTWDRVGKFNETYEDSGFIDLEYAFRASVMSKLYYLDYDAYTFDHGRPVPRYDVLDYCKRNKIMRQFFSQEKKNVVIERYNGSQEVEDSYVSNLFDEKIFMMGHKLDNFIKDL